MQINSGEDNPDQKDLPDPIPSDQVAAFLHLANMQFTARMLSALLNHFSWDPRSVFAADDLEFDLIPGFTPAQLVRLRDPNRQVTSRQLQWMERSGAWIARSNQPGYPDLLREIPDAPPFVFVRGTLDARDSSGVGIVGSRSATPYGLAVAEKLAADLARNGVTVVSGGAAGIDTKAHTGALNAGGRTIAVLGCGIDVDYPRDNHDLFERICTQGAVVSEYGLGAPPDSFRFPQRNRIISGMSLGTLVIEAPRRSGSLITAKYAVEHGRQVLTVPANIDRPNSEGSNDLLKDGAVPVTEVDDVLVALRLTPITSNKQDQLSLGLDDEGDREERTSPRSMKSIQVAAEGLPENQKRLLLLLSETPEHLDTLASRCGLSASQASVEITMLELAGLARRLPGNAYILALGA